MSGAQRCRALLALRNRLELERSFGSEDLPIGSPAPAPLGPDPPPPVPSTGPGGGALEALAREVAACTRCEISTTRRHPVFGEGNPRARLMFIGEAPGAREDSTGRPFVGPAGQLLTRIIRSIGLERSEVYIANVLKCRPPGNRTPAPDEMESCAPYLQAQIRSIRPRVICTLGAPAARAILGLERGMRTFRGQVFRYEGIAVVPTFHPAYLLRNPGQKVHVWRDIQLVAKLLQKPKRDGFSP